MATKDGIFKSAMLELGHRFLVDTGEAVEAGRVLNAIYDRVVLECLSAGSWDFAMETAQPASGGATPSLGYDHVYTKPSTWLTTEALAIVNTDFAEPVLSYYEDRRFWAADTGAIDVRYVSSDTGQGLELAKWPHTFTRFVELELAYQSCLKLTQSQELHEQIGKDRDAAKDMALERDTFHEPWPTFGDTISKARVIHGALIALGELGKISVRNYDVRRALGRVYDRVIKECIALASWNFAMETLAAEADTGPDYGYTHMFQKPADWVRTQAIAGDSTFKTQTLNYYEDARWWGADTGQLWIRYVSNDTGHGYEYARWPAAFSRFVELELALQVYEELVRTTGIREMLVKDRGVNPDQVVGYIEKFREGLEASRKEAREIAVATESFQEPWPAFSSANSRANIVHAALNELGEVGKISLASVDARRVLDRLYDEAVAECLAAGSWNFAMETIQADADTGVTPAFGYTEVFAKPSDWVRTIGVSADDRFVFPLLNYYDDANFWSADVSPIYIRYVSNDTGLGYELTRWPQAFRRYVELELAARACTAITKEPKLTVEMEAKRDKAKKRALNIDVMNEPQPRFAPPGNWTTSRSSTLIGRDRGNRSNLTG